MPQGDLYVLTAGGSADEADGWARPRPIEQALREAISEATGIDETDLDDIGEYVDRDEVTALLDADDPDETVTFGVEDNDVTIHGDGSVESTA